MNASGVNQYLSPARSAATACAYSRHIRVYPIIICIFTATLLTIRPRAKSLST